MPLTPEQYDSQFGALARYASEPARRQFGWGDRLGAAVDSAQAGLYGIGEAVGSDWAGEQRRRNQVEADYTRQRAAEDTGAPTSYQDVNGVGSGLRWVGGLLVDSAPQLATTVAAGMVAGPLGLSGAAGRLAVAGAAGYPMALGDILQNQREESGRTDLGSAAALAVPYAAADMLGVEGALARGGLTRNAIRSLDNIKGLKGGLARTGASMARTGVEEGVGETLQEVTNQFGRMAVNPNATLFSPEAVDRYKESFVGGAAMGGAFGGVGGWRRSGLTAPPRNVDQGPTDLLSTSAPPAPAAPPLQLGFRGYDTGVGEMVSMPDGSVMLRSEYDAMQRTGRRPDGSFNYLPPALSDTRQPSGEPFRYEGAIPFEPTQIPPAEPRQGGLRMRVGSPGAQVDLFDPLGEAVVEYPAARPEPDPLPPRDTATPDMLQENPTAMVPTMFNPAQPPAPVAVAAASSQRGQSIGAVAMNLRSRLVQQGAAADGFTTKLALDISQRLHSLENLQEYVQLQETELEKAQAKLDRKVTGGSNMLTPDEYAAERAKIEDRRFALEAAKELVQEYQRGRTNAQAEEARGRAAPGTQVGKAPQSRATERTMRDQNMAGAVAQNDQRVAENAVARTEQARMEILRQVMGSPSRGSAVARVRDALRANGYTNMDLSDQEMAEIRRLGQRRADVRAATVVPPGLAAAQGRLTPRASLENADASPGEPAAASPAPPAAVAGVQPAGSQRDAGVQPQPLPPANPPATAGEQAASAVPADGERAAALEGVTSEALVKVADTAEDTAEYEGALDELYRRWRDDGDAVAEAFFEKNATVVGFAADMARVRERAGENAPEPKTREGKRGLRMGGVGTGKLSDGAKATDALLRGLGGPKYRTVESAPQGAGTVDVDGVVAEVKKMLPGVEILVFDTPQDAGMASPPGGELAVGTMYQGRIYLFRYAIDSRLEAMRTIFHELFHKGLREMMPRDEYHRAMDRLYAADPEIQRRAHEWGRSPEAKARQEAGMSNRDLRSHAIEEALADMAEDLKTAKPGTIRAIANWMASIAERMGLKDLAQWLRRARLSEAQKFIEDALQAASDNPDPWDGDFVPLGLRRAEAFKTTEPPKFDRADPLGSSAFKRWFGKSKIVTASGKPKIMYHGTARDITAFRAKQAGAIFVTDDPRFAEGFASASENWMRNNGLEVLTPEQRQEAERDAQAQIKEAYPHPKGAFEKAHVKSMLEGVRAWAEGGRLPPGEALDFIRAAAAQFVEGGQNILPLYVKAENPFDFANPEHVAQVMRAAQAERLAEQDLSLARSLMLVEQDFVDGRWSTIEHPIVQRAIRKLGFDGFYVREGGQRNLAVYSPTQLKSATGNNGAFDPANPDIRYKTEPADPLGSSAFKRWFGDSKVVDAEGRPLVVYHGTGEDFSVFQNAVERGGDPTVAQTGLYFAEDSGIADIYGARDGGNVMPVYLNIRNPLDLNDTSTITGWKGALAKAIAPRFADKVMREEALRDGMSQSLITQAERDRLMAAGYDGIKGAGGVWIAFRPEQIKSAIGNRGTFDPANPDIRYSTKTKVASALDQLASQLEEAAPAVARILRRGDVKEIADLIVKHDVRSHVRGEPDMDFWTEQLMGVTRSEDPTLGGEIKRLGRVQYSQARGPKDILKLKVDAQAAQEASGLVDPFITLWDNFKEGKLPAPPEPPQWSDYSDAKDPFYHNERMDNPAYAAAYKAAENNFREYNRAVARLQGEFAAEYGLEPPFYEEDKLYGEPEDHVWSLIFAAADAVGRQEKARADADKAQMQRAVNSAAGVPGRLDGGAMYRTKPLREAEPASKAVAESFAKVPYANTTIGRTIQDALYNIAQSPWALPWTTNDQIAEGYKHIKPVVDINRATGRMAATANRYMEAAAQTAKRWRALADPVQLSMQRVMLQSTMDEMHVSIEDADGKYLSAEDAWKHASNNHLDRTPANRAKFGKLYQEFHALPAPAKAVYDQVRKDLETQHEDMLRALRKGVADQYVDQLRRQLTAEELNALANEPADARRAFKDVLSVAGTRSELRALERMYQALRDINAEFGTVRGPYFPLVRFGNHVVVMKSADLQTLEDRAAAAREELQAVMEDAPAVTDPTIEAHDAKVAELRKAYNDLRKAVDTAKQDESKYVVEFHESPAQAERARLELERKNPAATVRKTVRENYYRALEGASPAFLNDLTQTLSAALDSGDGVTAKAKDTALQAMKDMYLRRQPERSALRAELKRMGIEGVQSAQMLRGYAQATRNGAWRISRLTHSGEVLEGLQALSEDRYNADAKHVLNELKARFVGDLVPPEESKVLQSLQNTTYFMHLGFNISYFATNATQAWTTSLPVMAGRHGVVNAANSLTAASKDVIRLLSQATAQSVEENGALVGLQLRLTDEQIRKLAKDDGEAAMLKALTDDGVIDITIKHDLGAISDGAATSTVGRGLQKTMELSSALANYPELYNRLATALAAYRMEAAHRGEGPETDAQVQERAQQYAEKIINRTHFNYSPENAPRMMRSQLGRLVFQFKRYQQGMIYLFAKLIKDSVRGESDEVRANARNSLAYLLGMTTAVGGVVSLPIAAPIALAAKVLASAYPDDDEPEWLQQWYNGMKDSVGEGVAQALVKGLPTVAGLDLSGKLGQGNLLNPVAFANTDGKKFFSRDYFMAAGFGLLGPSASLVANEAEAVGYLQNGDIVKAAERGAPTFAANIIKAYRRSQEGMTTKAGDTLMEPEEFSLLSNALKAAGFESVKVSDTYDNRSAYMNMLAARQEARKTLLRNYYEAVKTGDSDAQAEAKQAISEFNQRQPADQVKPKDLAASLKQHATRAKETVGGLRVGKRDQDSYNRLMGE